MLYIYAKNARAKEILEIEGAKLTLATKSAFSGLYNEYNYPIYNEVQIYKVEMPYKCSNKQFRQFLANKGALLKQRQYIESIEERLKDFFIRELSDVAQIPDSGIQRYVAKYLRNQAEFYEWNASNMD